MNTQTHVLLAVALVGTVSLTLSAQQNAEGTKTKRFSGSLNRPAIVTAVIFGALLPDLSLFVMFGYAVLTGVPGSVIWSEMYYAPFWQSAGALTNSIPLYVAIACGSYVSLKKQEPRTNNLASEVLPEHILGSSVSYSRLLLAVSLAAFLHVITDLPLHNDDGHPHFWPFTNWIYSSPVSYWDADHYANLWVPVECILGLFLVAFLWFKTRRWWSRLALALAGLSYIAFPMFFFGRLF